MPMRSQAQRGLMQGIASGGIPAGGGNPPKAVAKEFAAADHGGKLPAKAKEKSHAKRLYGKKKVAQAMPPMPQQMPPGVPNG